MGEAKEGVASGEENEPVLLAESVGGTRPRLMLHDRRETISNFLRAFGVWQRPILAFMMTYLKEGDVFVDVGANLGYFSVYAALCVGASGRVHAVEPDPDNAALLAANIVLNGLSNVRLHQTAVSDFCGDAPFFHDRFNAGGHSLLDKGDLSAGPNVTVTTVDRLLAGEPKAKLIKIDVQGAEMGVLRGMQERLTAWEPKPVIIVEFSPLDLVRRRELDAFFAFVAENHYALHPFFVNERARTMPPQIRRATLRQIAEDFIEVNNAAEFDVLLRPNR